MSGISLYDYQLDAVNRMKNGCILCGGVGSGKSRTALAYYYKLNGGEIGTANYKKMRPDLDDLYIITTARKRDTHEWEFEMKQFLLGGPTDYYKNKVVVDSWNNIKKYVDVADAFFIFDEQRVVGNGTWVKSFLKIAKNNKWILLSATPGDTWSDYIPVFVANGFYKNRTDFCRRHVVWKSFRNYQVIDRYLETARLERFRRQILVDMDFKRKTISHHEDIFVGFDVTKYKSIYKTRWNIFEDAPIKNSGEFCYVLRKIVNSDPERAAAVTGLLEDHSKAIVFYNYDYELDILREICENIGAVYGEWNGHKHEPIPGGDRWVYLVQYTAGAEGWNCIATDTTIFYSQNYSYKALQQACGRIDRLNTPYKDLYYYHIKSRSGIDLAIARALRLKKNFNEKNFLEKI